MNVFAKAAAGGFIGKLVAGLFIAVCIILGVGPDKWAAFLLGEATVLVRIGYLLFAVVTFAMFFGPSLWKWMRTGRRETVLPITGMVIGGVLLIVCLGWFLNESRKADVAFRSEIRRVNTEVRATLRRYVEPRHLTTDQSAAISEFLKSREPQRFNLNRLKSNGEAAGYATDIKNALEQGGWTVGEIHDVPDIDTGIQVQYDTPIPLPAQNDPKKPYPNTLLTQALGKAGILGGSGTSYNPALPEAKLTLSVGPRYSGDDDLRARELELEYARKLLEEEAQRAAQDANEP